MGDYYQSDKLIDRIDWENIMKMDRCSGGHDEQMRGLLKNVTVFGHWNEGYYQGTVATCVMLMDTCETVIYNDYYGSCSGCDAWEDASDEDVVRLCKQLAAGAYIFANIHDCIEFLEKIASMDETEMRHECPAQYNWGDGTARELLASIYKEYGGNLEHDT